MVYTYCRQLNPLILRSKHMCTRKHTAHSLLICIKQKKEFKPLLYKMCQQIRKESGNANLRWWNVVVPNQNLPQRINLAFEEAAQSKHPRAHI